MQRYNQLFFFILVCYISPNHSKNLVSPIRCSEFIQCQQGLWIVVVFTCSIRCGDDCCQCAEGGEGGRPVPRAAASAGPGGWQRTVRRLHVRQTQGVRRRQRVLLRGDPRRGLDETAATPRGETPGRWVGCTSARPWGVGTSDVRVNDRFMKSQLENCYWTLSC